MYRYNWTTCDLIDLYINMRWLISHKLLPIEGSLFSVSHLQLVQNASGNILINSRKDDHLTPVWASWSSVATCSFQNCFKKKIILITFEAEPCLALNYVPEPITRSEPSHGPSSSAKDLLALSGSRLLTGGNRAVAVKAPQLWNTWQARHFRTL